MEGRKYQFSWDLIGDMSLGRPNLGPTTRVEIYRLMQFAFRDILERHLGTRQTDEMFYEAGYLAGVELYKAFLSHCTGIPELIRELQQLLKDMMVGILRVEQADIENGIFIFSISEDLDCSGLPELDYEICIYDEGLIAGLLESFTQKKFKVKEIDCWTTGSRTCRFRADLMPAA